LRAFTQISQAYVRHGAARRGRSFQVVNAQYSPHDVDRLPAEDRHRLKTELAWRGVTLTAVNSDKADAPDRLAELRDVYEPYLHASAAPADDAAPWIHKNRSKTTGRVALDRAIQARALEHRTSG